jgi:pyruvate/2-oxoglutarate dehydrogenase complex dihydrolipoamide acyltransferase (E2) component
MSLIDIKVPNIGDFAEVGVIELLVNAGDTVSVDQSLITVESDKASMEIPSSHAGVVKEIKVKVGDKVAEGSVVLSLEAAAGAAAPAQPAALRPPQPLPHLWPPPWLPLQLPWPATLPAPWTWTATSSFWAVALAATPQPSALPTWA